MVISIVLTAVNAVSVLEKSGFVVKEQWSDLARHLGVPLAEREKLIEKAARTHDYLTVLEETLEWWISNQQSSWEILVSLVDTCGGSSTAGNMRKRLGLGMPFTANTTIHKATLLKHLQIITPPRHIMVKGGLASC